MVKGDIPVLVGAGQSLSQWDGKSGPEGAPSALSLMVEACQRAIADAGGQAVLDAIDQIGVVRTMEDSIPPHFPHGHNTNIPGTLARDLGASPNHLIYEATGGQSPQALVNELAAKIHAGECACALVTGAQAVRAAKGAQRNGFTLDWSDESDAEYEDRGWGPPMLTHAEVKHGLVVPGYFYALFENALATQMGETRSEHRHTMAELFQPFSAVAAANPHAQFPTERTVDFLATPSPKNYEFADPFTKWFMAQDAVNQGAAVIVMSETKADALGISRDKRVYLHGAGEASDDVISLRPSVSTSFAMTTAVDRALAQAEVSEASLQHLDLYSCFPCAVFHGANALGIDWRTDPRELTQTGGLSFFGGPGNNYSLHAIAEMMQTLRDNPGDLGLVLANGGWMTKEAVGIYSTTKPPAFTPVAPAAIPSAQLELCEETCSGKLETFTVTHGKSGPEKGIAFVRLEDGRRALANASGDALETLRAEASPIGRPVDVMVEDKTGTLVFR